jgi:glycosyltransferase involved in cell wall biosynthesis
MNACTSLVASSFGDRFAIVRHDNRSTVLPRAVLPLRAIAAVPRVRSFTRILRSSVPDAVLVFASAGSSFVEKGYYVHSARSRGIPVVLAVRSGRFRDQVLRSPAFRQFAAHTVRHADLLLCQGERWVRFYADVFGLPKERCLVIENWVSDEALFDIGAERVPRSTGRPLELLYLGWIEAFKGVGEMVRAFARVANDPVFAGARLVIAGAGRAEAKTRALATGLGLGGRVHFPGWLDWYERRRALESADVLILPSWNEGLPNVLVEAMAAGLPAIVTPVGSVPDLVTADHDAMLVPVRDERALSVALTRIASDSSLRTAIGRAAHATAERRLRLEPAVSKLADAVGRLVGG